eukprot:5461438-Prymnesium_polylepis.1
MTDCMHNFFSSPHAISVASARASFASVSLASAPHAVAFAARSAAHPPPPVAGRSPVGVR